MKHNKKIIFGISILSIVICFSFFCPKNISTIKTSPHPELALRKKVLLDVSGNTVKVEEISIVLLPSGPLFVAKLINENNLVDADQKHFAYTIAKNIYQNKIYEICEDTRINGEIVILQKAIGIAIVNITGTEILNSVSGQRFKFSFTELSGNVEGN